MLTLFSCDDHIIEHSRVWTDRLPQKYRELGPHVVVEDDREYWVYEDTKSSQMGLNAVAGKNADEYTPDPVRFSDMIPGCYDPVARAKDMAHDNIVASLCFPTLPRFGGALFPLFKDKALANLCVKAYNDFVIDEWCASVPGLYVPMILGQLWDPVAFAAEVRRNADRGARAVSFPENTLPLGLPSLFEEFWFPVWDALVETKTVLCMHIGSSGQSFDPSPPKKWDISPLTSAVAAVGSWMASVNVAMSPIPRAFPEIKVCFSEGGIGWVPAAVERADRQWLRHRKYAGWDDMLPSEVFARNLWFCMIEEPVGITFRHLIGVDRILWECDYPHVDSPWPHSQEAAQGTLGQLPPDELRAITFDNSAKLFRWDPSPAQAT